MAGVMTARIGRTSVAAGAPVTDEPDGVVTQLQRTTTQSIANSSWTAVSWSSAIVDSLSAWSSGTDITVPTGKTGVEIVFHGAWADSATGSRGFRITINTTVALESHEYKALDRHPTAMPTRRFTVAPGDVLKAEVFQDTGTLNFYDALDAGYTPTIELKWFA